MKRIILSVLLAGVLAIPGLLLYRGTLLRPPRQLPVYQDKTLYQWIAVLDQAADLHPADFQEVEAAQSAIRAIGTNALPFAMADLHARATLTDRITVWLAKHAPFLKLRPKNVRDRWELGVQILDILGPISKPCLPELIMEATNHPGYSEESLLAAGGAALPAFTNPCARRGSRRRAFLSRPLRAQYLAGRSSMGKQRRLCRVLWRYSIPRTATRPGRLARP